MIDPHADLRERLGRFIARQVGGAVTVTRLQPIAGGASRESWLVDVTVESGSEAGEHALVMRRDLGSEMQLEALSREAEFKLLQMAQQAGVTVPRPRWLGADPTLLERPFFLMDRVEGESIGPRVVRLPELAEARARLPEQMAEELARIHRIGHSPRDLDFLPGPAPEENPARHNVAALRELAAGLDIFNPAYELAFRWLERNAPRCAQMTLVHGDFRIGNMIVGPQGLRAVIDWEFAHRGDPAEDLAWPCVRDWRFGNDGLTFGGIGRREDFLAAYERAAGHTVDPKAVRYWEIMGNVKWAVGCQSQANRHLSGRDPGVELASLGRRAAEMELEFLTLIEQAPHPPAPSPETKPPVSGKGSNGLSR